ncbi:MAG: flagellar basal body P-ring protein FlgI [Deltaproteobacteria bacterium]|nr:MAG: flagellar basal body P-ring protein FlgI [Deltaproteobacteria bacterium]
MPARTKAIASLLGLLLAVQAGAERIKDVASVHGVRSNQLVGYGLVVGLKGTGDSYRSRFTIQSLAAMLGRMGVRVDPRRLQVRNVAAVVVVADLPPFARAGSRIDVVVSSIGDARSLVGGTLVFTPLKGADGNVYAVAQGELVVGGWSERSAGSSFSKNHTTVGRIPQGALVEREVPTRLGSKGYIQLDLNRPDFTTAARIAEQVNKALGAERAKALDPGTVRVELGKGDEQKLVSLVAKIEELEVATSRRARVVVSERTGTVVMGAEVRIHTVAITHGNLHLEVRPQATISQPNPLARGRTTVVRQDEIGVRESVKPLQVIEAGTTLGDVVRALNAVGATPRDLIQILQAIHAAGALPAELQVI